jgi:acetyl esterase
MTCEDQKRQQSNGMPGMQTPATGRTVNRLTARQHFELKAARMMLALPPAIQMRLSGRRPIVVDGLTLHPQMQLLLVLRSLLRPARLFDRIPLEARSELRRDSLAIAGRPIPVGSVIDVAIEGDRCNTIGARHYAPPAPAPRPLLVYYHGGGFVAGDLDTHDGLCRRICRDADIHVLSVDYRLAPEHPFPAAVEDAIAAFRWAHARAGVLGAIPGKVAVGGDSAGGNLAAVVSQVAAADDGPLPYAQVLLYPPTDRTTTRPSLELLSDGFFLTRADIDWYHLQYTGSAIARPDPMQNPLCATHFSGLPPALIVTAGFDPLRDEGEAYAEALRHAGVPVIRKRFDGLLHDFCSMSTISSACDAAMAEIVADLRGLMDTIAPARTGARASAEAAGV